ncbi:MAG: hypothetical protein ABIV94_07795 [Acidimicrobiales bacterium]
MTARRLGLALVIILVVATAFVHGVRGAGFYLDDWLSLRNAHFDGALRAAGHDRTLQRPGEGAIAALMFGLIGAHPLLHLVVLTVARAAMATALWRLLRHVVPELAALLVLVVWVLQPTHLSMELWSTAINGPVAFALAATGVLVALGPCSPRRRLITVALIGLAGLTYEAVLPIALVALCVLPVLERKAIDWWLVAASTATATAAAGWVFAHRLGSKADGGLADPRPAFDALFGYGISPSPATARVSSLVAVAAAALIVATAVHRKSVTVPAGLVSGGVATIILGVAPFSLHSYEPLGAGDRANLLAAIGGSMVWAGIVLAAWQARRVVGGAALGALVVLAVSTRWRYEAVWDDAARVGPRFAVAAREARPRGEIVVIPGPLVCGNVAAIGDPTFLAAAVQLARDEPERAAQYAEGHGAPADALDLAAITPACRG